MLPPNPSSTGTKLLGPRRGIGGPIAGGSSDGLRENVGDLRVAPVLDTRKVGYGTREA